MSDNEENKIVENNEESIEAVEEKVEKVEAEVPKKSVEPSKFSAKYIAIIAGAVLLVLIIAITAFISNAGKKNTVKSGVNGYVDDDGKGYVLDGKGGAVEVGEEIITCSVTADKKHIQYIDEDRKIFVANGKAGNEEKIGKDASRISYIRNDGFVYADRDDEYYRYSFGKKDSVKIGKVDDIFASSNQIDELHLAYIRDGKLYLLQNNSAKAEKIAKADAGIIYYVSDDGKYVVWSEKGRDCVLHITTVKEDLEVLDSDKNITVRAYANGKKFIVFDGDNKLYNIDIKGKILSETKIKNGRADVFSACTSKGLITTDVPSVSSFYISVITDKKTTSIYYIDGKGNATEIVDDIKSFSIINGKVYFLDGDNVKAAKIGKEKIKKAEKIYKDIKSFDYLEESGYLVMQGTDGELLCAKPGKDAVEVSDSYKNIEYSYDQKTIYFIEDVKGSSGTLMSYKLGAKAPVELADDVFFRIIEDGEPGGFVTDNSFYFFQKSGKKEYMLMFIKGTKVKEVVDGFRFN